MYKVGDWLKNKHTGKILEITEVITSNDGIHTYLVKGIDNYPLYSNLRNGVNYSLLKENWDLLPLARLLYYKKV